jgi:hypothetical protein
MKPREGHCKYLYFVHHEQHYFCNRETVVDGFCQDHIPHTEDCDSTACRYQCPKCREKQLQHHPAVTIEYAQQLRDGT